jgi:hypothetical protein
MAPSADVTPGGERTPEPPADVPPTSEDLIAAALEAGAVDHPTSLLYRVYAAFGNPALPAEYRSAVIDVHAATFVFNEIDEHAAELTPEIARALAPYLARPNDPTSIFSLPSADARQQSAASTPLKPVDKWAHRPAAGGKARVWTPDGDLAEALLEMYAAEVDKVWPKVFSLTREPTPDEPGEPVASVNPDAAIDLYFVDLGTIDPRIWACHTNPASEDCTSALSARGGYTNHAGPKNERTSSAYVVIDTGAKGPLLDANIAHELTHTSQFTYDRYEGGWLLDSTATWAEYRTLKLLGLKPTPEYNYLPAFFGNLDAALTRDEKLNRYDSWLYYLSLEVDRGDQLLPPIFKAMAPDGAQDAGAVEAVYPFQASFGKFALSNWNRDTADRYREHDSTFPTAYQAQADYSATVHPGDDQVDFETGPLSADYAQYTFAEAVRQVIFRNTFSPTAASVWLIARTRGTWREPEEVTGEREYCFGRPDEDLDELVVIVGNPALSGAALAPASMPTITASDEECELADVEGTLTWTAHGNYHDSGGGLTHNEDYQEQITISVRMNEGEHGFADAGSSFVWTGHQTRTETSSLCTIQLDTEYKGAGLFAAHGADGASIGLRDDGGGTWTLSTVVAGTMYFTNSWTHVDCEITPGGEQPTAQFAGCDSEAVDMSQAATDGAIGTISTDGRTINFACEITVTEARQHPPGQRTHTVTMNGTLYLTTRGPHAATPSGYRMRGGLHPETATLANVLANQGVVSGVSGEPLTEAAILEDLGDRLGAIYQAEVDALDMTAQAIGR